MLFDEAVGNLPLAAFLVSRLREFRGINPPQNLNAVLAPFFGADYQSQYEPATLLRPQGFFFGDNRRKILLIDGVTTNAQAEALMNGYGQGDSFGAFLGKNQYLIDQADWFYNRFQASSMVKPEHLDFVGYSLGGAIATVLKYKLVQLQSTYKSKVITFGAPRAGTNAMATALSNSPIARYMTAADPIPLLPPRMTDAPALIPLLSVLVMVRYGTFVHTNGGIVLDQSGNVSPGVLPPVAAMNVVGSLAAWYLGQENAPNNPHALTTYQAYLNAALLAATTPAQQTVDEGPRERQQEARRKEMTREEARVVGVINAQGHAQNRVPQVTPEARLFKAVRQGAIWYVSFGDQIVMTAPIEKRARHIAKAGNDFLRSMQKQAIVDPVTLLSQFTTFLELAANPTSGFSPTIKVGLDM